MDEISQLATAGLAIALAALLVLFSYLFLHIQSVKHPFLNASEALALKPGQVPLYQSKASQPKRIEMAL